MDMRVEALAAHGGVSVDTVRYYQTRGLLDPPRRQGRVAWYDNTHLERLRRIRSLQARGFTLATIARLVTGRLDAADEALVTAVADEAAPTGPGDLLDLDGLAARTGIPAAVLQAVSAEGLLVPKRVGDACGYSEEDVAAAQAGLAILGWGIPLSDLLQVARAHHQAMTDTARRAVELFDTHVRHATRDDPSLGDEEAAARVVAAFHALLPAAASLVSHHFARVLLQQAMDHIEQVGSDLERQATTAMPGGAPLGPLAATASRPASPGTAGRPSPAGATVPERSLPDRHAVSAAGGGPR